MNIINENTRDKENRFKISNRNQYIPEGNKPETEEIKIKEIAVPMPIKTASEKNLKK